MQQTIIDNYKVNAAAAGQEATKYKKLADTYSLMRLSVFALMLASIYVSITMDNFNIIIITFVVGALAFAWLVSRQSVYDQKKQ